ncbi:MAG: hypothetical protein VX951_10905, partial [Planctomycetota bacterium]|nr:hypothetical protein [Planctomycetota bacterium]
MHPPRRLRASILGLTVALGSSGASAHAQYDPKAAEPIPRLRGTFFLVGGGDVPAGTHEGFLEMAGGTQARLVLLAPPETPGPAIATWKKHQTAQCTSLTWQDVSRPAGLAQLSKATGVWILGDSGNDFADATQGTPVEQALRDLIARSGVLGCNGGIVRALGKVMIRDGQPHAKVRAGLALVPGVVLDDRFTTGKRR